MKWRKPTTTGRWREDFALVKGFNIHFLRYGPPLFSTFLGPKHYDWSFADDTFNLMHDLNIVPIVDLCHFGLPDWLGNFQNPDFPGYFAEYCGDFAARYPWVKVLHACERDQHRRALLRALWLVERANNR